MKAPSYVVEVCLDCGQKNRVLDPVPLGKVAQCGKCKSRRLANPDELLDDDDVDDEDEALDLEGEED